MRSFETGMAAAAMRTKNTTSPGFERHKQCTRDEWYLFISLLQLFRLYASTTMDKKEKRNKEKKRTKRRHGFRAGPVRQKTPICMQNMALFAPKLD